MHSFEFIFLLFTIIIVSCIDILFNNDLVMWFIDISILFVSQTSHFYLRCKFIIYTSHSFVLIKQNCYYSWNTHLFVYLISIPPWLLRLTRSGYCVWDVSIDRNAFCEEIRNLISINDWLPFGPRSFALTVFCTIQSKSSHSLDWFQLEQSWST